MWPQAPLPSSGAPPQAIRHRVYQHRTAVLRAPHEVILERERATLVALNGRHSANYHSVVVSSPPTLLARAFTPPANASGALLYSLMEPASVDNSLVGALECPAGYRLCEATLIARDRDTARGHAEIHVDKSQEIASSANASRRTLNVVWARRSSQLPAPSVNVPTRRLRHHAAGTRALRGGSAVFKTARSAARLASDGRNAASVSAKQPARLAAAYSTRYWRRGSSKRSWPIAANGGHASGSGGRPMR